MRLLHAGNGDVGGAAARRQPGGQREEIREALDGNICRCTGYQNIVKSIQFCQAGMQPVAA
jgi:carbon-monoxide dehydrogenase small subunit